MESYPEIEKECAEKVEYEVKPAPNGLTDHTEVDQTPEEKRLDRRLLLKMDLIILPLLTVMYFLASLDRGDIGNAAVAGMTKELNIAPSQLSTCVSVFFVGYILFQLPGDIFLLVLSPNAQLGCALMAWGTFTTLLCTAPNWQTVAGVRVLIGAAEAFLQAGPLYLAVWYKRQELATRGAVFFSMAAIAGSMNGLIAYGITINLSGVHGWMPWRWIFLIEGLTTVGFGIIVLILLPPVPSKLTWGWSAKEKELAIRRSRLAYNVPDIHIKPKQLLALMKDPKIWFCTGLYICVNVSLSSFSSYLPVILASFGYSALRTQLLVIPVYVCAAVSTLLLNILSDRFRRRGLFLMIAFAITGTGWLILLLSQSQHLSFAGTFLIGVGSYPSVVLVLSWMNSNIIGFTKRAGGLATINIVAQCFTILATKLYSDPPRYFRGNGFSFAFMVAGFFIAGAFQIYLHKKNVQKRKNQNTPEANIRRTMGIEEIMDDHPDFFYFL